MINRFPPSQKLKKNNPKAVHITLLSQLSSHCIPAKSFLEDKLYKIFHSQYYLSNKQQKAAINLRHKQFYLHVLPLKK